MGAEIIIGGAGNDTIKGNLGNDILDGDAWLNVRIRVLNAVGAENTQANELFTVDSLTQISARLLSGEINPGQLAIVREILQSTTAATDVDTAVYNGNRVRIHPSTKRRWNDDRHSHACSWWRWRWGCH